MQKNAIENFTIQYNNNDFDKIYESFSPKMQSAYSKKYYFNFFATVKKSRGSLLSVQLVDYSEKSQKSRAQYTGHFDYGSAIIRITMNAQNQIIGFYIKKENLL